MGSDCYLHLYAESQAVANSIFEQTIHEIARIESRYSRYQEDSLLAKINAAAHEGTSIALDDETAGLSEVKTMVWEDLWGCNGLFGPLASDLGIVE